MNNEQNNLDPTGLLIGKIYPLTIVSDRNGGMYSKGKYLAFNNYVEDIPKEIDGNDKYQEIFWNTKGLFDQYKIGKGNTINDAVLDLHSKMQQPNEKNFAEAYQPLFDLMNTEHDKILTVSEMNEIISASFKVYNTLDNIMQEVCDVEGCDLMPYDGGGCWRETGYWSVCQTHLTKHRSGENQPVMKKEAVEREASRLPDGRLPT